MTLVEQVSTNTLPKLLARNALSHPRRPGMREKDRGIWKTYSWHDCQAHVQAFALGLAANGFGRAGPHIAPHLVDRHSRAPILHAESGRMASAADDLLNNRLQASASWLQ